MGRGQAVRHQVLALLFGGSNPSVPDKLIISNKWKTSRRKKEKKDLKRMLCSKYTYPKNRLHQKWVLQQLHQYGIT
jgi:hypothetical protein